MASPSDHSHILRCLALAEKCPPTETAFNVGCLLVVDSPSPSDHGKVISDGYSREMEGNTHAEECALEKLLFKEDKEEGEEAGSINPQSIDSDERKPLTMYTTMEPCSIRLSGNKPCTDRILEFNTRPPVPSLSSKLFRIGKVVIGCGEPDDFVVCEGAKKLKDKGIEVIWLGDKEIENRCLEVARGTRKDSKREGEK